MANQIPTNADIGRRVRVEACRYGEHDNSTGAVVRPCTNGRDACVSIDNAAQSQHCCPTAVTFLDDPTPDPVREAARAVVDGVKYATKWSEMRRLVRVLEDALDPPPATVTLTVELSREDAEWWEGHECAWDSTCDMGHPALSAAARAALREQS